MKRLLAILLMLFSPSMLLLATALCCALALGMPECNLPPSCHQDMVRSATCCAAFDAGPASASLHSGQFTLAPPADELGVEVFFNLTASPSAPSAEDAPVFASPPVLNLRI